MLGRNVKIGVGTVLGGVPQDLKFKGERTTVEIGDDTVIREYTHDQSRHIAIVQDDGRDVAAS